LSPNTTLPLLFLPPTTSRNQKACPAYLPLPLFLGAIALFHSTAEESAPCSCCHPFSRLSWSRYNRRHGPFSLSARPGKCYIVPTEDPAMGNRLPDSHHGLHKYYFLLAWPFIVLKTNWKYLNRMQHFSGNKNKWGSFKKPHLNFCSCFSLLSHYIQFKVSFLSCIFLLWEIDNFSTDKIMNQRSNVIVRDKNSTYGLKILSSGSK
jgi:hypothetical protein